MKLKELKNSGAFVASLLGLVLVLVPFGIDVVTDEIDVGFKFPVRKTIRGWFVPAARATSGVSGDREVNWPLYRKALAEFTDWADGRSVVAISLPPNDPAVIELPDERRFERRIWHVPVTSCTAAGPAGGSRGYVFVSGVAHSFGEGSVIEPTKDRCGYEIVNVGERSVWFRAIFDPEEDEPVGIMRFPDFTRVEGEKLVRGNCSYGAHEAFTLVSGGCLVIDSFLPPDAVVFKILDESYREKASFLCVIIDVKGGR